MDFTTSLSELNTILGDSDNVTFTVAEKTRALTKAWNDSHVVGSVWDESLTFSHNTFQYDIPENITVPRQIYLSRGENDQEFPEPISRDLWEVVDEKIQFRPKASSIIQNGQTLYIKGGYKLDPESDTLDTTNLQEYVLSLAGYNTLALLAHKKANLFLKNDTSMSELIMLRRELERDVRDLRAKIGREFESV